MKITKKRIQDKQSTRVAVEQAIALSKLPNSKWDVNIPEQDEDRKTPKTRIKEEEIIHH